jgi:sulfate adenylyltransferase subunit 1 (EFTu-like GTPase family)
MATGASTANLAVILIDATKGVLAQTRRHTYIASLLGIPNVLVAINKMDLVEYREEVFLKLQKDFDALAKQLAVPHVVTIPISALAGDNVVERGERTCPGITGRLFWSISKPCRFAWKRCRTRCAFPCNT